MGDFDNVNKLNRLRKRIVSLVLHRVQLPVGKRTDPWIFGWEPNNKRREFLRGVCRPAFRLPARLAVGFGLEALPACGRIHPGRWQAVAHWFPRSSAPRIRLTNHHHGWRHPESIASRAKSPPARPVRMLGRWDVRTATLPTSRRRNIPTGRAVEVVPRDGIEPPTRGFSVLCSTN